nr:DUF4105 domain-containing protein [Rheinheimera faecalis]
MYSKQSWYLSALFLLLLLSSSGVSFASEKITSDVVWTMLLHSWQGKPQITDPQFLLSLNKFSEQTEQELTLDLYKKKPQQAFCRYPARLTYLSNKLGFNLSNDRYEKCPELKKFIQHVPFQQLDLVFASEVLSSASSMMGHIFLKTSGENFRKVPVSHSLAYFTEITTFNPAKLIVESTMTGMPGFFSVRPFEEDLKQYKDKEQRNVWQFELSSSSDRLHLLQLHVWELYQINLTYYFQSFNCATLTLEMLALLNPDVLTERGLIVSPVDVVKAANTYNMITKTTVDTSDLWLYNALRDSIPSKVSSALDTWLYDDKPVLTQPTTYHPLSKSYLSIAIDNLAEQHKRTKTEITHLREFLGAEQETTLDLSNYKHPAKTPQDSAAGLAWRNNKNGKQLLFYLLPTGHFLHSDNRQYLSESELQIAKTTLAWNTDTRTLKLDELTLYSVTSLNPDTRLFPLWSGEFYLGYKPVYTENLAHESLGQISGALGKSYDLHRDVVGFTMLGTGLTSSFDNSHAFIYSKTGLSFDLASDTKLIAEYIVNSGESKGHSEYQQLTANFIWFPDLDNSLSLKLLGVETKSSKHTGLSIEFISYF